MIHCLISVMCNERQQEGSPNQMPNTSNIIVIRPLHAKASEVASEVAFDVKGFVCNCWSLVNLLRSKCILHCQWNGTQTQSKFADLPFVEKIAVADIIQKVPSGVLIEFVQFFLDGEVSACPKVIDTISVLQFVF